MLMFKYPTSGNVTTWLADYNENVDLDAFPTGIFGLAIDVWRDGEHLFRSYSEEHSETMDSFCRRNYPQIAYPEYDKTAMGANVPAMDRFPVPTRDAFTRPLSLTGARDIIRAAIATAQWPHAPSDGLVVPKDNALRQRLHNHDRDWMNLKLYDVENRIAVRAVIGKIADEQLQKPLSEYYAVIWKRQDAKSDEDIQPRDYRFIADTADLSDVLDRKPILKIAKKEFKLKGQNGRVLTGTPTQFYYKGGQSPCDFTVERQLDLPTPAVPESKRLFNI